jgi:hypothetical protein
MLVPEIEIKTEIILGASTFVLASPLFFEAARGLALR